MLVCVCVQAWVRVFRVRAHDHVHARVQSVEEGFDLSAVDQCRDRGFEPLQCCRTLCEHAYLRETEFAGDRDSGDGKLDTFNY